VENGQPIQSGGRVHRIEIEAEVPWTTRKKKTEASSKRVDKKKALKHYEKSDKGKCLQPRN